MRRVWKSDRGLESREDKKENGRVRVGKGEERK